MASPGDVKKGYVDTEAGQIHYRRCGQGPPTVLLLHSANQSSAMFTSALRRLGAAGLCAVALDLPNSGESCRAATARADAEQAAQLAGGELTMVDVANLVLQAAHGLHFSPPFDIVGHEAGATVAIHIAAELPHIVRRLALWAVPMLGFMDRGDVLREDAPDTAYHADLPAAITTFLQSRFPEELAVPWQLKVRTLVAMLQTYERRPWLSRAMAVVDHGDLLKRIETPVLFMAGDGEPLLKATRKAALLCRNGEYVHLGAAGRDVVDEIPDDYTGLLLHFLSSDPSASGPVERASCSVPAGSAADVAGGVDRQLSDSAVREGGGGGQRPLQKHLSHNAVHMNQGGGGGGGGGGGMQQHAYESGKTQYEAGQAQREHAGKGQSGREDTAHMGEEHEQRAGSGDMRDGGQQAWAPGTNSSSSLASTPIITSPPGSRSSNDSDDRRSSGEKRSKGLRSFFRGKSTT